jgi:ankyrin repeat protein
MPLLAATTAHARPLMDSEIATLAAWRAGDAQSSRAAHLAEQLGAEGNWDAVSVLLQARYSIAMNRFVNAYRPAAQSRPSNEQVEAVALRVVRDPSFDADEESYMTRAQFLRLLQGYESAELFQIFYDSAVRELTAERKGRISPHGSSPHWFGLALVVSARVPGIEEQVADLLPLTRDACQGRSLVAFFETHAYPAAFERLRDLYLRTGVTSAPAGCAEPVTHLFVKLQTRQATEAIAQRLRWLTDQPADTNRDKEILSTVSVLGAIPGDAQVDYEVLRQEVLGKSLSPQLRSLLEPLFQEQLTVARQARDYSPENLDHWVWSGNLEIVRSFIAHGANLNAPSRSGDTPLVEALHIGDLEIARALIDAGADVNLQSAGSHADLPLHAVCKLPARKYPPGRSTAATIASLLLAHGAMANAFDRSGVAPIHHAAASGNEEVIKVLLARGVSVNVKKRAIDASESKTSSLDSMAGATPLHYAARERQVSTAKFLLDHKANIDARTAEGATPLLMAVAFHDMELAQLLIARGANVNIAAKDGASPVIVAHEDGNAELEKLLKSKGAHANPIMVAKRRAQNALLELVASGMH